MDDFGVERPELTGSLISLEFGHGGRIGQLWVTNPNLPEEGEEFQFVLGPLNIGEEIVEDYYPGTILLGARTHPDEPWILSRNANAYNIGSEDPSKTRFDYDFALLEEIGATGTFFEIPGIVPQICWELQITNRGRQSMEIGELAFPFALNNIYEGYPRTDEGIRDMYRDRVYVHKYIGGAASYLFAQRLNADPPGLLVFPGEDTKWEFYNHVPASLTTPYRWEGIPVVYVHSRAAIEREEWGTWFNEHTTLILEPGETRRFQTRFAPGDRDRYDNVAAVLAACGRPSIRLLPSAVAPANVGIAVEVTGATPTQFYANQEAELETDADEEGGFCFVKPQDPGPLHLSFEDTLGRESTAHLLFTEPIDELIKNRAKWILANQIEKAPGTNLDNAILVTNVHTGERMTDPEDYSGPFGIESSLADALFLAEKNTIYPEEAEIEALERYIREFLQDDVQNPGTGGVGSSFADSVSVAQGFGRSQVYPIAFCLYHAMARVARLMPIGGRTHVDYLRMACRTAISLFEHAPPEASSGTGSPLYTEVYDLLRDLKREDLTHEAQVLGSAVAARETHLLRRRYPFAGASLWTTSAYQEAFTIARRRGEAGRQERAIRYAFAARSTAPSWWWYGSDKRWLEDADIPHPGMFDKGEMCLGPTTCVNSLMFFHLLGRDYSWLPEPTMRLAFGGLLGVWALIRADGAAAMGFCPDAASRQYGMNPLTGDVGISLYAYLRHVASYVLPSRNSGVATFGCHFEIDPTTSGEQYVVRPWDGVGRRIIVRQLGLEVEASFGKILELRFDGRRRVAQMKIQNTAARDLPAQIAVRGLWGTEVEVCGKIIKGENGEVVVPVDLRSGSTTDLEIKVTG